MEPTQTADRAKKLWNLVRVVFFMLRKSISKRKLMVDLHLMLKRGKIAGKALGDLVLLHNSSLSCRPDDAHLSFVTPREYEFSCSNSPANPSNYFPFHPTNRKSLHPHTHSRHRHRRHHHHHHNTATNDDVTAINAFQRVWETMLNAEEATEQASPLVMPGFGRSPLVRQLRITDSPFPLRDADEDSHVDKAAEEFIGRFYEDLMLQKKMATLEASYHDLLARRSC